MSKYPTKQELERHKQNPNYFVMRFTLKEKLKRRFGFGKVNRFECWVKDRTGKQYKCFIDLRRTKEYPNGKCKFLGVVK
jgi:hypothetical protein